MQKIRIGRFLLAFQIMVCCFGIVAMDRSKESAFINDIFAGKGTKARALVCNFNLAAKHSEQSRFFSVAQLPKQQQKMVVDLTEISSKKQKPKVVIPKSPAAIALLAPSPMLSAAAACCDLSLITTPGSSAKEPSKSQRKKANRKKLKELQVLKAAGDNEALDTARQQVKNEKDCKRKEFISQFKDQESLEDIVQSMRKSRVMIDQMSDFLLGMSFPELDDKVQGYIKDGGIVTTVMHNMAQKMRIQLLKTISKTNKSSPSYWSLQDSLANIESIQATLKTGRQVDYKK
jgi:hypothetical protein